MTASQAMNPVPNLTFGILAGGPDHKGVLKYAQEVGLHDAKRKVAIKNDGKKCTCTSVVFALLAVLSAGGAATLIAFSGGPNNAILFYSGVALSATFVGITTWLIVIIARSIKHRKVQNEKVAQLVTKPVEKQDALTEMEKPEVTKQQISVALKHFSIEQRQDFIAYVQESYFPEAEKKELTEQQEKVLAALADCRKDLLKLDSKIKRGFALQMLKHIDPAILNKKIELHALLFKRTGAPLQSDQHELQIFARHPEAVARLAQNQKDFTIDIVKDIFGAMINSQKTLFLKTIANDFAKWGEGHDSEKEKLKQIIAPCIKSTFSDELIAVITKGEPEDDAAKAEYGHAKTLITELARWPEICADRIFLSNDKKDLSNDKKDVAILTEHTVLNSLYSAMDATQKETFVSYAAEKLPQDFECAVLITIYAQGKIDLPEMIQHVLAKKHEMLAKAWDKLNADGRAAQSAINIVKLMSHEDQDDFLETIRIENIRTPHSYQKHFADVFLKSLVADRKAITKDHCVVLFFMKHPSEFKTLVLDNQLIDKNMQVRAQLALDLLEKMDTDSEKVLLTMDSSEKGYPFFNCLVNKLVDETKDAFYKIGNITRDRLVARFMYSKKHTIEEARNTAVFRGSEYKMKADGPEWENFKRIAETQRDAVWLP